MLLISAKCRVKPEHWQDFAMQVEKIIPLVHKEPGCFRYELLSDVYTPGLFVFHEEWESENHLTDHIATTHMQDHFALTAGWMEAPVELTRYLVTEVNQSTL
jgi:quinol monooxygenase YgiN